VLYGIWYLGYGESNLTGEGVLHAASWAVSAMAAAAAAPFGLGAEWGTALVILGVLALGWRLTVGPAPPRLVGVLAAGGAFWLLTGAARSVVQPPVAPDSSRYLTLGSVVLLLAAVELARGVRVPPALLVYGAMITVVSVALGLPGLRDRSRQLRTLSNTSAAELGALELSAARAPADFSPDSASPQVRAGPYLEAVKDYGSSPADTLPELEGALSADRAQADQVLQKLDVQLAPLPAGARGGGCSVTRPAAGAPAIATATVSKAGIVVRAMGDQPAQLKLRRFADGFGNAPIAEVRPGQPMKLRLPADASPRPYVAQVQSAGPVAVCATA
jgi:hypothetical protein